MKKKKTVRKRYLTVTTLLVISSLLTVFCALASNEVAVKVSGRLLDFPPCEVYRQGAEGDKGAPIRIAFDEVAIQRIDGALYRQNFTLTVSCEQAMGQNVVIELGYNGTPSDFDVAALGASQKGLGVRLYKVSDSQVVTPNSVYAMTLSGGGRQQIPLYAVPVKAAEAILVEGKFTASATLALNYP